jgi:hypothetical protein
MMPARRLIAGLKALFQGRQVEQELDEELRAYLDTSVDENVRAGMAREVAARAARLETARASRSKRSRNRGSLDRLSGRTLMATVRSSRVSRARYTSPIPPVPRAESISYGPTRALTASGICASRRELWSVKYSVRGTRTAVQYSTGWAIGPRTV